MNKRRMISMLLSALLLMGLITPVGAAGTPKVTLSGSEVSDDGTIILTAKIEGNPGLAIYQLYFYYDTDVFEAKNLEASGSFGKTGSMLTNSIAVADSRGRYDGQAGKDGMLALWYNGTGTDTSGDGEMAVLQLKLKDGVQPGSYEIGLDYSKANTINEQNENVRLDTRGVVYTVAGEEGATQQPTKPQQPTETQKPGFSEIEEEKPVFEDIEGNWAESYILESAKRGLVNGKREGIFDPDANMTRAEFMTILWRTAGSPTPKGKATFTDLPMEWYQAPIAWAEENGITNGTSPTTFDPNGNVTREQMMTILYRMAGSPIGMESLFTSVYDQQLQDSASISSWAKNAVYWSIFHEILCGEQSVKLGNIVAPREAATRSQIAVSIIRYLDR